MNRVGHRTDTDQVGQTRFRRFSAAAPTAKPKKRVVGRGSGQRSGAGRSIKWIAIGIPIKSSAIIESTGDLDDLKHTLDQLMSPAY